MQWYCQKCSLEIHLILLKNKCKISIYEMNFAYQHIEIQFIMGHIILLVLGYFLLKLCGKILRKVWSAETTALWLAMLFCWFLLDWFWMGAIILAWLYILMPVTKYQERRPKRYKRNGEGGINKAILWIIPIFQSILIAKMFLSGKTYKSTLNEYDYEQFLKGNGSKISCQQPSVPTLLHGFP